MNPTRDELQPYFDRLEPQFRLYIDGVSPRSMALPIETCAFLWWACDTRRAESVCDLGSGFTSYVLRRYAAGTDYPVTVHSVDDHPHWLARSRSFVELAELSLDGFMFGDDWLDDPTTYDVVVHDYSSGDTRNEFMAHAADRLRPGGWLIIDDAQHWGHHFAAADVCRDRGMTLVDIWAQTIDQIGRFGALIVAGD